MTKHLRLAVAAFSAVALLLAGCADDNGDDTDTLTEDVDTDADADADTDGDLETEDDA
jgi:type IV pilus biogenesis protein CpaD/CtpE